MHFWLYKASDEQRARRDKKFAPQQAESVVHVFEAEADPPHAMIQQREATTKVMGEFEEINTRPAIRAYFNRLLWVKGDDALDEKQILNSERACTFRKTAEAFHLIDADTCTVYVPNEGNAEDIAQLRAGLYSRALIRRLGRSSVNVYHNSPSLFSVRFLKSRQNRPRPPFEQTCFSPPSFVVRYGCIISLSSSLVNTFNSLDC